MSDTLDILGIRFTNVEGIIATNSDGTDLKYTRHGHGYTGVLRATLTPVGGLSATLGGTGGLTAFLNTSRQYEKYNGQYEVIPKAHEAVILPTSGLLLSENITVTKVPYYETSNIYNGLTVYIAEDNNG